MEFRDAVRRRRMVRRYLPGEIDHAALERILDAARHGPSAGFTQAQSFVVVTDAADRRAVAECCDEDAYRARGFDPWVSVAPVLVVPCTSEADYRVRYAEADKRASAGPDGWVVPYWWVDAGAALMLLLLAAVDEGLAAGFLDVTDRGGLRALLRIPGAVEPIGVVTLGSPAEDRPSGSLVRGRRTDRVHRGRWGGDQAPER
jgi:nitroreductase